LSNSDSRPPAAAADAAGGEEPPVERKLAAILAADVEGYARMMHANEEQTLAVLTAHRRIVDGLILGAHGQIFGAAGDSVLAEFPSVVEALQAAIAIQQALGSENALLPPDKRMHFRIGINVGDVMATEGDVFGEGVNIAARIERLAEPGGICVSRAVRDQLRDRVEARFEDLGEHNVKNIARPVRVFRVLFDRNPAAAGSAAPPAARAARRADSVEIAYWESVQDSEDDNEYRLYLQRYPSGAFADLARARLATGAGGNHEDETQVEVAFWETVRESGNAEMVHAYLQKYPDGEFRSLAEILLEGLQGKGG